MPTQEIFDQARAVYLGAGETHTAKVLHNAGVVVGLAGSAGPPTNLRWEAGLVHAAGVPRLDAMRMATSDLVAALGGTAGLGGSGGAQPGTIAVGEHAHFTLYSGDPLATDSEVMLMAVGRKLSCRPPATPWDLPWQPGDASRETPSGVDFTAG